MDRHLAEQVAVNTDNITRLFSEQERMREKLHSLESDRATVLLLAQKVDDLAKQLPAMVGQAADRAAQRVAERTGARWQQDVALIAIALTLIGLLVKIAVG